MSNIASHFLHTLPIPPSNWEVLGHLQEYLPLQLSKSPPLFQRVILGIAVCESPHPQISRPQIGPACEVRQLGAFWPPDFSELEPKIPLSPLPLAQANYQSIHSTLTQCSLSSYLYNTNFMSIWQICVCLNFSRCLSHYIHLKGIIICPLKYPR